MLHFVKNKFLFRGFFPYEISQNIPGVCVSCARLNLRAWPSSFSFSQNTYGYACPPIFSKDDLPFTFIYVSVYGHTIASLRYIPLKGILISSSFYIRDKVSGP